MILELVLSILVLFVTYMLFDVIYKNSYWRRKGVPGPFQYPLSSSFAELTKIGPARFDEKCIRKFGNVFGVFEGSMPVIVISDLEMLKSIMVKDFTHFVNRRGFQRGNKSVLNLALTKLKDQHWKDVRSVVAPTFTSGKLRLMTALLHECCETLCESINTIAEKGAEIEARRLYLPATLDIITSTFFATKVNSQDPNSTFMRHVRNAFATKMNLLVYIAFYFPRLLPLAEKLGMQTSNKASTDYFVDSIKEIIRMRLETKDQSRKDFLQLMLNSVEGGNEFSNTIKTSLDTDLTDTSSNHLSQGQPEQSTNYKITIEELVAQSVIFLMAGYETTASTLAFLTHSLAVHPGIQERLRQEILEVVGDSDTVTYDHLSQMEYLDCCVNETLRMYPPAVRTERQCNTTWTYNGVTVEKGDIVAIPIYAIHHDPAYWPDPEQFNPDRFLAKNKHRIMPYSFQAFGQGPRNCIGMRFAYFDIKVMMASTLPKFRFERSSRTEEPLTFETIGLLRAKNGLWVNVEKL